MEYLILLTILHNNTLSIAPGPAQVIDFIDFFAEIKKMCIKCKKKLVLCLRICRMKIVAS